MKIKFLVIGLVALISGSLSSCSMPKGTENTKESNSIVTVKLSELNGEITKIIDENTVLVKYTTENDQFVKAGEILKVTYEKCSVYNKKGNISYDVSEGKTVLEVGDKVFSSFDANETKVVENERIVNVYQLFSEISKNPVYLDCMIKKVSDTSVEFEILSNNGEFKSGDLINFNIKKEYLKHVNEYKMKEKDKVSIKFFPYSQINSEWDDYLYSIGLEK
jgi:hypothetical protein